MTELDHHPHPVMGNTNNGAVGYKHFAFGQPLTGQFTPFTLRFRTCETAGRIDVWPGDLQASGERPGSITIDGRPGGAGCRRETTIPVRNITGRHAVFLTVAFDTPDAPIADFRSFVCTRDTLYRTDDYTSPESGSVAAEVTRPATLTHRRSRRAGPTPGASGVAPPPTVSSIAR